MKIFKKLIPIAAAASSVAIVAPMVTSCGFSMIDLSKEYTPAKQYVPTEEEKGGVTPAQAKEIYDGQCFNNKNILRDDIYYNQSRTGVSVEGITAKYGFRVDDYKLLGTVNYSIKIVSRGTGSYIGKTMKTNMTETITVKNAKITIQADANDGWKVTLGAPDIASMGEETIEGKIKGYSIIEDVQDITYSGKTIKIDKNSTEPTERQEILEFNAIFANAYFSFVSYFLANLPKKGS